MPIMKRVKGKATKIAYKVLGTPPNLRKNKTANNKVNEELYYEETTRVR